MNPLQIIIGVLLFAAASAVLYVWGLKKSVTQHADLERILLNKCAGRVLRHLKTHEIITDAEIAQRINGIRAGQFWSRRRIHVGDAKKFTGQLTRYLLEQQYIEPTGRGKYRLKK